MSCLSWAWWLVDWYWWCLAGMLDTRHPPARRSLGDSRRGLARPPNYEVPDQNAKRVLALLRGS